MPDHLLFIQDLDGKSPDRKIGGGEPVTALPGPHGSGIPGGSRLVEHAHEGLVARQVGTAQFHLTIDRVDLHVYPTHLGIGYLGRQALDDQEEWTVVIGSMTTCAVDSWADNWEKGTARPTNVNTIITRVCLAVVVCIMGTSFDVIGYPDSHQEAGHRIWMMGSLATEIVMKGILFWHLRGVKP